jgi:hypothetical protein
VVLVVVTVNGSCGGGWSRGRELKATTHVLAAVWSRIQPGDTLAGTRKVGLTSGDLAAIRA